VPGSGTSSVHSLMHEHLLTDRIGRRRTDATDMLTATMASENLFLRRAVVHRPTRMPEMPAPAL
jgi:hypothetical protein